MVRRSKWAEREHCLEAKCVRVHLGGNQPCDQTVHTGAGVTTSREPRMPITPAPSTGPLSTPFRVGSLFSGYGGLDIAVEHVFGAETAWFSEINAPVSRVFAHHWPDAPNLGDITSINWSKVPPVDVLCGGFPCQDVSVVGKMVGLAPGTRSGLWSYMAEAIDGLRPEYVLIENVRGLLSASAVRATPPPAIPQPVRVATPADATPEGGARATPLCATVRDLEPDDGSVGNPADRPLRAAGAVLGDLADLGYDTQWFGLPASAVGAAHPRFRVFILARAPVPDPARRGFDTRWGNPGPGAGTPGNDRAFASDHRPHPPRPGRLTSMAERIGDVVVADRHHVRQWGRYAHAIARWEHITGQRSPTPAFIHESGGPRTAPVFLEWLMGLTPGWVTDPRHELTVNQQTTALGNGVLPLQAATALHRILRLSTVETGVW